MLKRSKITHTHKTGSAKAKCFKKEKTKKTHKKKIKHNTCFINNTKYWKKEKKKQNKKIQKKFKKAKNYHIFKDCTYKKTRYAQTENEKQKNKKNTQITNV